ncbi:fibronectin type III domain-containing protein [Sanguibacter sp. A247]|uniref:fibronectin type III domain-containing protein n=1 Tax=unclassified Sanguibacter TaxID=2645534 RepID=UPI003FD79A13
MRTPRIVAGATAAVLAVGLLTALPTAAAATDIVQVDTTRTSTTSTGQVRLAWKATPGATTYTVQVSDDRGFGSANIVDSATTSALGWVPTSGLWGGTAARTLFWRVIPNGVGALPQDATVRSFTRAAAPVPVASAPASGSTVTHPTPVTFSWQPVPGAASYTLTYGTGAGTPTTVSGITTTAFAPAAPLGLGSWQWSVRAHFPVPGSATATFAGPETTLQRLSVVWPDAASRPNLISPADGARLNDVTLTWSQVAGASKYLVELSADEEFSLVSLSSEVSGTAFTLTRPLPSSTYYWRVRAYDAQGNAARNPSAPRQFRKIMSDSAASVVAASATTTKPVLETGSTDSGSPTAIGFDDFAITWQPVPRASFYQVTVAQINGGAPLTCKTASTTATIIASYVADGNQTSAHSSPATCLWSTTPNRAIRPGAMYSVNVTAVNVAADSTTNYQSKFSTDKDVVPSATSETRYFTVTAEGRATATNAVVPDQTSLVTSSKVSPSFSWAPTLVVDGAAEERATGYLVELYTDASKSSKIGTLMTPTPRYTSNGVFARNTTTASDDAYYAEISAMRGGPTTTPTDWSKLVKASTGSVAWKRTGSAPAAGTTINAAGQTVLTMAPTTAAALGGANRGYRVLIHEPRSTSVVATLNVDQPSTLAASKISYATSGRVTLSTLPAGSYEYRYAILDGAGLPGPYSERSPFKVGDSTVTSLTETVLPGRTGVRLGWSPVVSATSYEVTVTPQGGQPTTYKSQQTSLVLTDRTPGLAYTWSVVSRDKDSNRSLSSAARTFKAPVAVVATSGVATSPASVLRFDWSPVAGASRYVVSVRKQGTTTPVEAAETSSTSWTPTKPLVYGTAYVWDVRAVPEKSFPLTSATRPVIARSLETRLTVTTPPATPSGLKLVGGKGTVAASWTRLAGASMGSPTAPGYVLRFGVARPDGLDPAWSGTVAVGSAAARTLSGLKPATSYVVQIAAANAVGQSAWSRSVSVTTAHTAPSAPRALRVTRGNKQVTARWSAPSSAGSSGITGYRIQTRTYAKGKWSAWKTVSAAATSRSAKVTGLKNGVRTEVRVIATSKVGTSPATASKVVTPASKPLASTKVSAKSTKKRSVKVAWKAAASNGSKVTGYRVQYSSNGKKWKTLKSTKSSVRSYTWKKGKSKKTAYFRVQAKNALGWGKVSRTVKVTVR